MPRNPNLLEDVIHMTNYLHGMTVRIALMVNTGHLIHVIPPVTPKPPRPTDGNWEQWEKECSAWEKEAKEAFAPLYAEHYRNTYDLLQARMIIQVGDVHVKITRDNMAWSNRHGWVTDSNRHVLASCTLNDIQVWAEEFIGPNSQVSVVWQSEDKRTC